MAAPFALGLNGNAITLSKELASKVCPPGEFGAPAVVGAALKRAVEEAGAAGRKLRFGVVHRYSSHNFKLRYWLAASGIRPDEDVEILTVAPPFVADSLANGEIDGSCVGEPWNSMCVERDVGTIVLATAQIWRRGVEKVLALRERTLDAKREQIEALIRAMRRAGRHFVDPANWQANAAILTQEKYLAADEKLIARAISDRLVLTRGAPAVCGTDKGNAIINLHLATGRINRPGAGPFSMTGQPNAMGGREVGGLANMLACHLGFSDAERASVGEFWQAPLLCTGPGLKAVDLFRAVHEGKVKFLWIMATNPAVSMPDAGFVREALAKCPNVIVSDVIAETDTAKFAHVRLPALAWGEKNGTVTNSERCISRQRAFMAPPGEARADWKIVCDVAARLGHGKAFDFVSPAAVFREYAAMTGLAAKQGKLLDLSNWSGLTDDAYDRMRPFQWGGTHPLKHRFPTATGRANIVVVHSPAAPQNKTASFTLNTGRYRDQWHTMTRTGLSARLSAHRPEPLLEIAPGDARAQGLQDGGLARVATDAGQSIYRVAICAGQRAGEIFVPMHWTNANSGAGRTGFLVHSACDPVSGQPGFKNVAAQVAEYRPDWRAFLLSREPVGADAIYWVRSRIQNGWLTELAGDGAIDLDALLPPGERSEVCDLARGMRRILVADAGGVPEALLYITRSGELPRRDWLVRQFARSDCATTEWLAGRPGTPQPDAGPLICLCHDVGENVVLEAIDSGAASVAAIGEKTYAGANCGSCRPLIARLLEEHSDALKEAAE